MSRIFISNANPVKFVWEQRTSPAAYNEGQFDDMFYADTIKPWQQKRGYAQKWQTTDAIRLQFSSDFLPITINLINSSGQAVASVVMDQKQSDIFNPGFNLFECDISLAGVPEGMYFLRGNLGDASNTIKSEPLCIKNLHRFTKYIQYSNSSGFQNDIIFRTGFNPYFRVEANWGFLKPGTQDTMWEDQPLNPAIIDSKTFRTFPLNIGGTYGVPDWVLDKLNVIFSMDTVSIDGKLFVKAEGGQEFEPNAVDGYPMRGFTYQLRETNNRSSLIIDPTINAELQVAVVGGIDTKYFGDLEGAGTNQVLIQNYV